MIYTVTLNPSLDYIMHVPSFLEGETNRSTLEEMYPGGKGFNVSMILSRLHIDNLALGFIAGFTGEEIQRVLTSRGVNVNFIHLSEGLSRINVKMKGQKETEINGNGPHIPEEKLNELYAIIEQIQDNDTLVLAGSIPSSLPKNIYEQMIQLVSKKNIRIIVDATNEALLNVLPTHPFLIKPNHSELEEIFNVKINSTKEIIHYAKKLQEMGAQNVLVSLGKDGALLVASDQSIYLSNVAKGKVINTVGSGDSMIAGFLAGYIETNSFEEALRLGSAAGGATAFSADLAESSLIQEVKQQIQIQQIQ